MRVTSIETPHFGFNDNLYDFISKNISSLKENSVVFISSKIVAISQRRYFFYKRDFYQERERLKKNLIKKEAEKIYKKISSNKEYFITKKNAALILNAGIDPYNNECFIIYPKRPFLVAKNIYFYLKKKFKINRLGVVIVDSKTEPFRRGKRGFSLGFYGISPYLKETANLNFSYNVVDSLAALVDCFMSIPKKRIPLVLIEKIDKLVEFKEKNFQNDFFLSKERDIFGKFIY
ncbi:MAG: coenzyme F420-0:L-glutamate ligase [Patescibacteria group bacterium]|nr:coenzyme F420-0:L-glutamate ligase [Patescibacteria group bacterium]